MSVRQRQLAFVLPRSSLPRARSLAFSPSICPRVGTAASRHESACSPNASGESAGAPPDGGGLTPVSDTIVDGRRVLVYECTWNTLDTHNLPHRLVATATFSPGGGEMPGGGTGGVTKTDEKTPEVRNLVITDVSAPLGHELVGYDPNSTQGASITFTFADCEDPDTHYEYTASFADTLSSELGTVEGTVPTPGTVPVTWDGSLPGGFKAKWGIYQVRVTVREVPNAGVEAVDEAFSFSALLRFEGYDVRYVPDAQQLQAKYRVAASETGCADASEVSLVSVDSAFLKVADSAAPTTLNTWHTVEATDPGEGGRFVLVGVDNERGRRRDHKGKPFACVNHAKQNKRLLTLDATGSLDASLLPPETKDMKWNSRGIVWGWTGPTGMYAGLTALTIWTDLICVNNDVHHQAMPNVAYISAHGNDSEFGPLSAQSPRVWMYGGAPDPDMLDLEPIHNIDRVNLIIMAGCGTVVNAPINYDDIGLIPASRKGAACAWAFQKHLKPYAGATTAQPTEGPFMRQLLKELSANRLDATTDVWSAPTVSEAYQETKQWWISLVDGGIGQYSNPTGASTPYYGYDSGFAFNGSTTKLDR